MKKSTTPQTNFVFDEKKHQYTLDGELLPGVTTILGTLAKPALIAWASKMCAEYVKEHGNKVYLNDGFLHYEVTEEQLDKAKNAHAQKRDKAADAGTDIHSRVEEYIKLMITDQAGNAIAMNGYDNPQLEKFVNWAVENKVVFHESEKKLYSPTHKFAGTADFTATIDGKLFVGDLKTSNGFYGMEAVLQCAGYRICLEEMGDETYSGAVIIRIGKDNSFEEMYREDPDGEDKKTFLALLHVYKETNRFKKWLGDNRNK